MTITQPGIYEMTDEEYHGDPVPGGSLSHSGATNGFSYRLRLHFPSVNVWRQWLLHQHGAWPVEP